MINFFQNRYRVWNIWHKANPIRHRIIVITIIVWIAFGLRLYSALTMFNDYDEDEYIIAAADFRDVYDNGSFSDLSQVKENEEHPPLVKMLYGVTLDASELVEIPEERIRGGRPKTPLPKNSMLNGRLQSVLWGTLVVLLVASIHSWSGFLLAINSIHVHYSSVTYLDALPVLFIALSIFFYWQTLEKSKSRYWFIVSGVCLGIGVAAKYPYAIIGFVMVFHALYMERKKLRPIIGWLMIWGIIALMAFFICNPYLWANTFSRLEYQLLFHQDYADNQGDPVLYRPILQLITSSEHLWHVQENRLFIAGLHTADILMFLGAVPGIIYLIRERTIWGWWLVGGFIFLMMWNTQWIQHKMMVIVPYTMACSYGWGWITNQIYTHYGRFMEKTQTNRTILNEETSIS